jgi:hypothetical protein
MSIKVSRNQTNDLSHFFTSLKEENDKRTLEKGQKYQYDFSSGTPINENKNIITLNDVLYSRKQTSSGECNIASFEFNAKNSPQDFFKQRVLLKFGVGKL